MKTVIRESQAFLGKARKALGNGNKKERRCAIYVRSACWDGTAWRGQVELGLSFCYANGFVPLLFGEIGVPGAVFQEVKNMAKKQAFECVFISNVDRFGRDISNAFKTLDQFRRWGVRVCAPQAI